MLSPIGSLIAWIDGRVAEILAAPGMWGSSEAVELQVILLMELRALCARPSVYDDDPRRVIDAYTDLVNSRFAGSRSAPLFEHVSAGRLPEDQLSATLRSIQSELAARFPPENPFERADLAISLRFGQGHDLSLAASTSYYSDLLRATRALASGSGRTGRHQRPIEQLTDFIPKNIDIRQQNGAPASITWTLSTPLLEQGDWEAQRNVKQGFTHLATMVEWAGSSDDVTDIAIDDPQMRTFTALQTRRLLPRGGIESVEIGGQLMGRAKPLRITRAQGPRLARAVVSDAEPVPFDRNDVIRAIDLDRGTIRIAKIKCYVLPELLETIGKVGVRATVRGDEYRRAGQQPIVVVEDIALSEGNDDNDDNE